LGFKVGFAEWVLDFEREFGLQSGCCRVFFGIRDRIRASKWEGRVGFGI
jgi:hypothetical protein